MSAKRIIGALKTAADYETENARLRAEIERWPADHAAAAFLTIVNRLFTPPRHDPFVCR
jgi:hypothetical protein